ncbi:MAG: hypothetical protein P8N58_04895 [Emcibacteraceae bacterium]|jgi:hypothetical protein|nr:hypothetical protein [Emcibacteraceae bacterium]
MVVTNPEGRSWETMLRACDNSNGEQVSEIWIPSRQSGSPMNYGIGKKQYIYMSAVAPIPGKLGLMPCRMTNLIL